MAPFHYHPLAPNKKQIRILTLNPGPWDSDIECKLEAEDLDESAFYEALSYVWGSNHPPAKILLHGAEHTVTPSLASALRHLRYPDRPRRLWVDALCIHQNDLDERAAQVSMMAEIYTKARTTVSWLGDAAEDSDDALDLILQLGDWTRAHEDLIFGDDSDEDLPDDGSIQTATDMVEFWGFPLRAQNWPAVWRLLERPYWSRVWIIQELAAREKLTRANGRICCGRKEVSRAQFDWFCALLLVLVMSGKIYRAGADEIDEPVRSMLVNGHPPGLSMVQTLAACTGEPKKNLNFLIRLTARVEATDPRDKLFALRGLAADGDLVTPDYKKSYDEVLVDFLTSEIQRSKNLAILLGNRHREIPPRPSWLPDLLHPKHGGRGLAVGMDNGHFQAAGSRPASFSIDRALGRISLRGVSAGEIIQVVGPLPVMEKDLDQANPTIIHTATSSAQTAFFRAVDALYKELPEAQREPFWRTLCLDGDWTNPDASFPAPADFGVKLRVMLGYEQVPTDFKPGLPDSQRYAEFVQKLGLNLQTVLRDRTVIVLKDGGMGVGPFMARAGDVAAVVFGAPFCLVLRPVRGRYRLVGDAYVYGAMHGELVAGLGPEDGEIFEVV